MPENFIKRWLSNSNGFALSLYATLAAFCTYSCMYAFRKPFSAAGFSDVDDMWGLKFKSILVISQAIGYMLSKFIGIKVVSEMGKNNRALGIILLIGIAELALLGFAVVPNKFKLAFLFLNGLPLGMVWGLVFSFLEGRKWTEAMGAGLCASFAFASGFVKTVAANLMQMGISEFWMPVATGGVFFVPLAFFVWMLSNVPEPTKEDETLRTKREPMNAEQRWSFFKAFAPGLILLVITYMFLTAFRDFRDNFMAEILNALGFEKKPEIFTQTEVPVTLGVLVLLGFIMFIKDNKKALMINHLVIAAGCLITGLSAFAYHSNWISPVAWVMLSGFGAYTAYIPFNCILFERLIAAFKYVSNAGFLIYVADSFGYLCSVGVLFYKDFFLSEVSWLSLFTNACYLIAVFGTLFTLLALGYFYQKKLAV